MRSPALVLVLLLAAPPARAAFVCNTSDVGGTNDPAVCAALGDLYVGTNGSSWRLQGGWRNASLGLPTDYCAFETADSLTDACVGGAFVALSLIGAGLSGSLPASLGNLSSLTSIDLEQNFLTGALPPSVGSLASLRSLNLVSNALSGSLPAQFASLAALTSLYLANSGLCGAVPGAAQPIDGGLPACPPPTFTCNAATNDPAICAALGQFYTATSGEAWGSNKGWVNASQGVATDYCSFFGMFCSAADSFFNVSAYPTILNLQSNRLTGVVPASIGALTTLSALRLNNNLLDGALPSSLGSLSRLTQLWLYYNYLTGAIPASLGNLVGLTQLLLNNNELLNVLPPQLGSLTALTNLNLGSNRLSGTLPALFAGLTSLRQLDLRSNFLHASIPAALSSLSRLDYVLLGGSGLCGAVPWAVQPEDGALPACSLSPNFVCAIGYDPLVCTALGDLYATANGSGWKRNDGWASAAAGVATNFCAGPAWYGARCNGTQLIRLQLPANNLVGSLAPSLGSLTSLQLLDLSTNTLAGSLPATFASLARLTQLALSDSGLCGTVPSAYQPNDGRLPSCPRSVSRAREAVADAVIIGTTIGGAVVAVGLLRAGWKSRHYMKRAFETRTPKLDEAVAHDGLVPAAEQEGDANALKEALIPLGGAPAGAV